MFARIAIIMIVVFTTSTLHAGWVDDWIDQQTSTGSSYMESQKRGFGTLGAASARWQVGNEYLLTVAKPQFKGGCGGIDAFLGGFSFLQFEQLVNKFQKVMGPAAAAFAFDIALSVLSQQAGESVKSLSAIVDRLNQLQLDDCKAAKGITATLSDGFLNSEESANEKSEAVKDFLQSSGISDLYNSINEMGRSKTVEAAMSNAGASSPNEMIAGCSNELKSIFFSDGNILDYLGSKRGLDSTYMELMRGMVGDIYVDATTVHFASIPPCSENESKTIDNFINGDTYYRDSPTAACKQITTITIDGTSYSSIRDWAFSVLQSAGQKVLARNLSITSNEFADYVAMIQVYNMLADFYEVMDSTIRLAQTTYETQVGTPSGNNQHTCKIQLAETAVKSLFEKKNDLAQILQETHEEYGLKLAELQSTLSVNQVLAKEDQTDKQDLASQLSGEATRIAK